jgi:hypothetical protein
LKQAAKGRDFFKTTTALVEFDLDLRCRVARAGQESSEKNLRRHGEHYTKNMKKLLRVILLKFLNVHLGL